MKDFKNQLKKWKKKMEILEDEDDFTDDPQALEETNPNPNPKPNPHPHPKPDPKPDPHPHPHPHPHFHPHPNPNPNCRRKRLKSQGKLSRFEMPN